MLRQRKNTIDKVVQKMDAFNKVPEDYVEPSISGAVGKLMGLTKKRKKLYFT
jgi:hypothetical protein